MPDPRKSLTKRLAKYQAEPRWEVARLGLDDGVTVEVGITAPNMVWVSPFKGVPEKVFNTKVPNSFGKLVRIGYDPGGSYPTRKQVLGHWDAYPDAQIENGPAHAPQHAFGAWDCDWVAGERLVWQSPVPVAGTNTVKIAYAKYTPTGWAASFVTLVNYASHIPASGVLVCIVVLDANKSIAFRDSDTFVLRETITPTDWPALVAGDNALFGIYLSAGMTEAFHELGNDDFIDLRLAGAIGGGTSISSNLTVEEQDGAPSVAHVTKIKFPNGSVTDETLNVVKVEFPAAAITGILPITNGGTGQDTAQEAIDALTNVAGASAGQVLTKVGANALFADVDVPTRWEPVTNGDPEETELIFSIGDIVMTEISNG